MSLSTRLTGASQHLLADLKPMNESIVAQLREAQQAEALLRLSAIWESPSVPPAISTGRCMKY